MRKRALITGASRGIGEAAARVLGREGYDLFLICKNSRDKIEHLQKELEKEYGILCETALCDVSDPAEVDELFRQIISGSGNGYTSNCSQREIHVLVNNAAISHVGLLTDMTLEEWHQVISTNLDSLFYICRQVVPQMIRRREGKIVNISSVWGNVGASMEVAYSASKGGVNSFTRALAKELAPSNIQVNGIAFGVIDTDMNACFSEAEMESLRKEIPADRIGRAMEAGEMIWQVINAPDYLTGQIITMDGGWI